MRVVRGPGSLSSKGAEVGSRGCPPQAWPGPSWRLSGRGRGRGRKAVAGAEEGAQAAGGKWPGGRGAEGGTHGRGQDRGMAGL